MMTEPITVTALNQYVKGLMDRDRLLSQVLVRSEISNYKVYIRTEKTRERSQTETRKTKRIRRVIINIELKAPTRSLFHFQLLSS